MLVQQQSQKLGKEAEDIFRMAREAAKEYGLGYVGTEHLLLAIVRQGEGLGAKVLMDLGVNEYNTKAEVDRLVLKRMSETWVVGRLPGTPHFKDVVSKATQVARGTSNWQIASEHVLLALVAERGSMGAQALESMGVTVDAIRKGISQHRASAGGGQPR